MGHHSINSQCFHGISASLSLQNLNFVFFTLFYTFQIQYRSAEPTEDKEPVDEEVMRRLTPVYTYDGFVESIFSH